MSILLHIAGTLKGVANGLFPDANYFMGYPDELNQASEESEKLFIGVNMFMVFTRTKADDSTDSTTVTIEFGLRDTFQTNSDEQTNILTSCEIAADAFINKLEEKSESGFLEVGQIRKVPFRKKYASTTSGVLVEIALIVNNCYIPNIPFPEYVQNVSKDISPLDWHL